MANLDTKSKRVSSVNILKPYAAAPVLPDGTLDQGDRQHTAWAYSGILAGGAEHATSGALTGQGATISGTAAHIAEHATSGALTGQGSTVSGTAARIAEHATSGALVGQGSTVSGAAAHIAIHATSCALAGSGSSVAGSAAKGGETVEIAPSGGIFRIRHRTPKEIEAERVRLGILPEPAKVIEKAARAAKGKSRQEAERILEREFKRVSMPVKPDYLEYFRLLAERQLVNAQNKARLVEAKRIRTAKEAELIAEKEKEAELIAAKEAELIAEIEAEQQRQQEEEEDVVYMLMLLAA